MPTTTTDAGATGDEILSADLSEVLAGRWDELNPGKQAETAERFVEENADACSEVDPTELAMLADAQIGVDYDRTTPIGDILLEACAIFRADE